MKEATEETISKQYYGAVSQVEWAGKNKCPIISRHGTLAAANKARRLANREFVRAMKPHGDASGPYVVIAGVDRGQDWEYCDVVGRRFQR